MPRSLANSPSRPLSGAAIDPPLPASRGAPLPRRLAAPARAHPMLVAKSAVESDGNCTLMAMPPPIGRSPDPTRAVPAGPRCVDLGCGRRRQPGAIGVDLVPLPGVDVVAHLEAAHLPFGDATLDTVLAFNVLEHLEDLPRVMQELARVLRPGGRCVVEVPYFASPSAFADATH